MNGFLALVAGSVAGGVSRYALSTAVHRVHETTFPLGTMIVNAAGCLIVGFLSSAIDGRLSLSHEARLLLITGFCGAFTTFSALILETAALARGGMMTLAVANVALSLLFGFAAFYSGAAIGRLI